MFTGYIVSVVGKQIEGYTPDGTIYGSVSGFTQARCPGLIRRMYVSPNDIYRIEDYTARNYAIMRMGIERNVLFELAFSTWEIEKIKICQLIFADSSVIMATADAPFLDTST